MTRRGFTLLEVLIVVGIIGAAAGVGIPVYREYQIRNDLNLVTEQVSQGLARARLLSQTAKDDSGWGFYVPAGILYRGTSYATRDPAYDEIYEMPSTITASGLFDVSYSRVNGVPSATGLITLGTITADTGTVVVEIKKESIALVHGDKFTICHSPQGQNQTLLIPDNAWPGHQEHGDTFGTCPGDEVASSSSSSSAASSAASSSSSSSLESLVCEDRFSVAADGTITLLGPLSLTYTAVGANITYGEGGPEIEVTLKYSKNGGGNPWTNLFGGNDIDGGEVDTTSTISAGSEIVTSFRGYYKKNGWLTFDQTFKTNDQSGHIIMLRDGDPLPDYPAFDDQTELEEYLQDILDAEGNIDISEYEVVYLVELGTLDMQSSDFQDAVVRLRFNSPSC